MFTRKVLSLSVVLMAVFAQSLSAECGDTIVEVGEDCDDGNTETGDGCDSCVSERGWLCGFDIVLDQDICTPRCGDGIIVEGVETCDDTNRRSDDGCAANCILEDDFVCSGEPSLCRAVGGCSDGIRDNNEQCDDGNLIAGDGCSPQCTIETLWNCDTNVEPNQCAFRTTCGDGVINVNEPCDDGNDVDDDGCSTLCSVEDGWRCDCDEEFRSISGAGNSFVGVVGGIGGDYQAIATCPTGSAIVGLEVQWANLANSAASTVVSDTNIICAETNIGSGPGPVTTGPTSDIDFFDGSAATGGAIQERLECPTDHFLVGISADGGAMNASATDLRGFDNLAIVCAEASTLADDTVTLSGTTVTVTSSESGFGQVSMGTTCPTNELATSIGGYGLVINDLLELGCGQANAGCTRSLSVCTAITPWCGNGVVETGEECDDDARVDGDGCSVECAIEEGYTCNIENVPSVCTPVGAEICGNGVVENDEACDDDNLNPGDGCSEECLIEGGFPCEANEECESGECADGECSLLSLAQCGNGTVEEGESCDDDNTRPGDGCSEDCLLEGGIACDADIQCESASCIDGLCSFAVSAQCGNGAIEDGESCDDDNVNPGDGCSEECLIENDFACMSNEECESGLCEEGLCAVNNSRSSGLLRFELVGTNSCQQNTWSPFASAFIVLLARRRRANQKS